VTVARIFYFVSAKIVLSLQTAFPNLKREIFQTMNNNLRKMILLAALGVLFGSAQTNFAQIRMGGYKKIPVSDAGAVAAAEYAVDTRGDNEELEITLDAVLKAERQTVEGTSYKLCCKLSQ